MADLIFQTIAEANIATTDNVTTEGVVTFTERSIYLGLGNSKKILYDGLSTANYLKSIMVDAKPNDSEGNNETIRIDKTNKLIYLKLNNVWETLGGSGSVGDVFNIIGEQYRAGNNITITDNPDGTKSINAQDMTFTGFNVVTQVPQNWDTQQTNSLLFII